MRIDQLLNKLCLVKTRSIAKNACDKNLVKINGKTAKASAKIFSGDTVEYSLYGYKNKIKILEIPTGNVPKSRASAYYEILEREKIEAE
ncbi:MAG: RNA-binding protein [Candidatus Cloacimonadota bacterium]|nr:MAG: RNA-binding protein [Candidatus Cloacimonadota bacterium]